MKSKASIAGHPIHPMVVGFPIALFVVTIVLQLAHLGTQDVFYYRAAMMANIAGVVIALLAAIPGAFDLFALPSASPARATGRKHAVLNLLTVALFAISAVLMFRGLSAPDTHIPLAFGMIGIVSMTYAGALGYALVQTHHVGIQPSVLRTARPPRKLPARTFGAPIHH